MKNEVVFFLPTRKGSQRVRNKNTRPFSHFAGGILELKLRQLLQLKTVNKVILSTNDEESVGIARKVDSSGERITPIIRPDNLCLDSTNLIDLVKYVPTITDADHILWGHVTTPFADAKDYDDAVKVYLEKMNDGYDSLVSVSGFRNFLFDERGQMVNNNSGVRWPRTQDLKQLYELNHAIFLASKEVYQENKDRVGDNPYFFEMGKLKSIDIDWEEDFEIAEALYEKFFRA